MQQRINLSSGQPWVRTVRQLSEDTVARSSRFGSFAGIVCISAGGLLVSAFADLLGRQNARGAYALFWLGVCLVALPPALSLLWSRVSRMERIGFALTLGLGLYLVKYLQYPWSFVAFDEFLHWRTAQDIMATHHLFTSNALLPVSPMFPGLEIVTTSLSMVTGLPLFASGVIVVATARTLLVLALFALVEQVTRSARIAGIAVAIYACNPHFLFFDANFAYESLALALVCYVLALIVLRTHAEVGFQPALDVIIVLGIGAIAITHHVSSYLLLAFLALWTVIDLWNKVRSTDRPTAPGPARYLGVSLLATAGWLLFTRQAIAIYLGPLFANGFIQFEAIVLGQSAPRTLFADYAGGANAIWERLAGLASSGLAILLLPVGFAAVRRSFRSNALLVTCCLAAMVYPVTLLLVFSAATAQVAERASAFVFLPLSIITAVGLTDVEMSRLRWWRPATLATVILLFVGGLNVASGPDWIRLPGPYLVGAESRSIDPQSVDAATWSGAHLSHSLTVEADRMNQLLLATYGHADVVTHLDSGIEVSTVYFAPTLGAEQEQTLHQAHVRYLLVDMRMASALPGEGIYFDTAEPNALHHKVPISALALSKFDSVPEVNRIFDSGDIRIYDVGEVAHT